MIMGVIYGLGAQCLCVEVMGVQLVEFMVVGSSLA